MNKNVFIGIEIILKADFFDFIKKNYEMSCILDIFLHFFVRADCRENFALKNAYCL